MKIVHISDLHFGLNHEHIAKQFLIDIKQLKPALFIISGDLTHRAEKSQFADLKLFLDALPAPILIVPGNHDIPLYHLIRRLFKPFKNYERYIGNYYSHHFNNETMAILGINSVNPLQVKDGKLSSKNLLKIKSYFEEQQGKLNVLFFHHNFDCIEGLHKPLKNEQQFLKYLKDSAVHIVCTGHLHYAKLSFLTKNDGKPCLVLHAGSLLCTRTRDELNSYYVIDTDNQNCTVDWRVFNGEIFYCKEQYQIDFSKPS